MCIDLHALEREGREREREREREPLVCPESACMRNKVGNNNFP
jgi:hypothetical protein